MTVTSAEVTVRKVNRYAKAVSYFIMKVPDQTSRTFSLSFEPIEVCGSSGSVEILLGLGGIKDWLLGSEVNVSVRVRGVDEVGREIFQSSDN